MKNILEELYYGNIAPNEHGFPTEKSCSEAMKIFSENEQKLTNILEGNSKKLFLDLCNAECEINAIVGIENFICGFRIGSQLIIEALSENSKSFY